MTWECDGWKGKQDAQEGQFILVEEEHNRWLAAKKTVVMIPSVFLRRLAGSHYILLSTEFEITSMPSVRKSTLTKRRHCRGYISRSHQAYSSIRPKINALSLW
jgi:hypothetical protein